MKVLWFTNIMLPEYARALGREEFNSGGWMMSLVNAVRTHAPNVRMTIACQGQDEPRQINGVDYRTLLPLQGRVDAPKNKCAFLAALKRCIVESAPDLVHFHGTENCLQAYYRELGLDIPTLTSIQGILFGYLPSFYGGLTPAQLSRHRNWINWFHGRSFEAAGRHFEERAQFEKNILMAGGNFCGRTRWDENWVRETNPKSRYHYVGEVLREPFYSSMVRIPEKVVPHSIYAGACIGSMLKGGHYLFEAVSLLKSRYPDICVYVANGARMNRTDWRRRIGSTEYDRYLRELISNSGLERHIEFLPSLDAEQVAERLLSSEAYVLPSLIENSPNSLGEAMMMRTPIVATNVGGVNSMMDEADGILVHSCDAAELAAAIDQVFSDPVAAQCRAEHAYRRARGRFSPETVIRDLSKAYAYACDKGGGIKIR